MKCVIGVISNNTPYYECMREAWVQNVKLWSASTCRRDTLHVYFIEGTSGSCEGRDGKEHVATFGDNCVEKFVANVEEKFENILEKTLKFFEYISVAYDLHESEPVFVIRSNLSTVFQFERLFEYLETVHLYLQRENRTKVLAGSFICGFYKLQTIFSGTNLTFTLKTIQELLENKEHVKSVHSADDVALSRWLVQMHWPSLLFHMMKRLDFVEGKTIFISTRKFDDDVFCYRFKTQDRDADAALMMDIIRGIYTGSFRTKEFIDTRRSNLPVVTENEAHEDFFAKPFTMTVI